ncbi:MAG: flippase-like domain-containing protein [Anaerolineae bacterium]|nr:flippase-like domain-containing protein [Anaerolineae bacterium]
MIRSKWLIAASGIFISLIFLWVAFRNLNPEQVWQNIQQANPIYLLIGAVVYFIAVAIISLRWQFLLKSTRLIPLRELIPLVTIGYAGNNVYPFRSGEILRIVLLQRNYNIPFARATTTVIVERVFDGLVMLTFVLVPVLWLDISSSEVRMVAGVAAPIFLTALVVFFVLAARPDILRSVLKLISRVLPDRLSDILRDLGEDIINGLAGLRTPADLAGTIVCSYLTWGVEASVYWLVSMAFSFESSYPLMLLVVGVVNLAGLIPTSPGQFGVFEFFASSVLISAGVANANATAFALVVHMVIWLPVTLVGLYFLLKQGLSLSAITRAQQLERKAVG